MKIALLLTGQLRTVDLVKYVHMNTIIKQYDTDVFLSIDPNNTLQCAKQNSTQKTENKKIKELVAFFKPKGIYVLNDFSQESNRLNAIFKARTQDENLNMRNINIFKILFEQYYVVKKAYELMIDYAHRTKTEYDLIIRLRFDQFVWSGENYLLEQMERSKNNDIYYNENNINLIKILSENQKIDFENMNDNDIHVFGFGQFENSKYNYANDQFFYHKKKIVPLIKNFYNSILDEMIYCFRNSIGNKGGMIECIWYNYLTKHNINLVKTNVKGLFVREINHQ